MGITSPRARSRWYAKEARPRTCARMSPCKGRAPSARPTRAPTPLPPLRRAADAADAADDDDLSALRLLPDEGDAHVACGGQGEQVGALAAVRARRDVAWVVCGGCSEELGGRRGRGQLGRTEAGAGWEWAR